MEITWVEIGKLKPNPKNPNKHSKDQIDRLVKLIKYQGWRHPIIVSNQSDLVVAGHGKLEAAKKMGLQKVPVHYQDFQDSEQEYAFLTSDNAIASWAELDLGNINSELGNLGPDFDLDLLGIKDFVIELADKALTDEDSVPEKPIEPRSKLGDLFLLGPHRLLCGDSTDKALVERLMNGEKADMVFTSPPYLDLRDYRGDIDLSITKLGGIFDWPAHFFCVNLGLIIRERTIIQYWNDWIAEANKRGLPLLSWNVWDKERASAPAHQQSMFGLCHEWIFVFGEYRELELTIPNKCAGETHAGNATVREKDGSLRDKSRTQIRAFRQLDSVLRLPAVNCRSAEYTGHPASFPVAFAESYVTSIAKGSIIGDPFCGSGSTLIGCEKTGRKCYGMEIDPHYCDVILERWAKFTGKDPIREDGKSWADLKKSSLQNKSNK